MTQPTIIPRSDHRISRDNIDDNALKVLYRLHKAGYRALLVGGGVRDMLLNHVPKDFDVATDAHPEQVKKLFGNCQLIGRRFRLAHIYFGRETVEVATFRGRASDTDDDHQQTDSGRILRDNVYGSIEEDAWRRDFTINALYYDIADFSVVDYVNAMPDMEQRLIRLIGDPVTRYREDPVRMLRAIRFAAKLDFNIHSDSEQPIYELGHLLRDIPPARLYDEILKLFHSGKARVTLDLLIKYGLLQHLFPLTHDALQQDDGVTLEFLHQSMASTDARVNEDKPITPAFLFAAMLWFPVLQQRKVYVEQDVPPAIAMQNAISTVLSQQARVTSIPKRFSMVVREIWLLQHRFKSRQGRHVRSLLQHHKFRAAYDFMCLRSKAGELQDDSCEWWTHLQTLPPQEQEALAKPAKPAPRKRRSRKPKTQRN
ncbi:MAG: polynucleotide adenylyltransferase PcnB [Gammaproteobacteria bacterium]|nr:MAG: polynucleotide adenylyltransferase PcnB [Gammaproteobacteria bacterium]